MDDVGRSRGEKLLVNPAREELGAGGAIADRDECPELAVAASEHLDLVAERDVLDGSHRVEERDGTRRLRVDRVAQYGHQRRDADATGDEDDRPILAGRVKKCAAGRPDRQRRARSNRGMQRARDEADPFHRDLEMALRTWWRADRVAPCVFLAVGTNADGEKLSRLELDSFRSRHPEG